MPAADNQQPHPRQHRQKGDACLKRCLWPFPQIGQVAEQFVGGELARESRHQIPVRIEKITIADRQIGCFANRHGLNATGPRIQQLAIFAEIFRIIGQRVQEHGHPAATDQAVIPTVVVVEVERVHLGRRVGLAEQAQSLLLDFGLDTAAAEGAALAAVGEDEHGGPGLLRRGAAGLH